MYEPCAEKKKGRKTEKKKRHICIFLAAPEVLCAFSWCQIEYDKIILQEKKNKPNQRMGNVKFKIC